MGVTILENEPFHPGFDRMPQQTRSVMPKESDELLINPGMGFQTYQRFNGDPTERRNFWNDDGPVCYKAFTGIVHNNNYPDTSTAYLRWFWERLEPKQGKVRWEIIDRALDEAEKRGQQLHMRIMSHDQTGLLPAWYIEKGRLIEFDGPGRNGRRACIPDYADPFFRSSVEKLVSAAGRRYNLDLQVLGGPGLGYRRDPGRGPAVACIADHGQELRHPGQVARQGVRVPEAAGLSLRRPRDHLAVDAAQAWAFVPAGTGLAQPRRGSVLRRLPPAPAAGQW